MRMRRYQLQSKRYPLQSKRRSRIAQDMSNLALAEMTDAELDELSSGIAYARLSRTGTHYSHAELELWNTVQAIFNRHQAIDHFVRGMDGGRGFGVQQFLACAQTLEAVVNRACARGKRPDKVMRMGMRRLLLDCLCHWLKGANVPLSPKALLQNIDKLEHAVDQEYPGYIDAGILSLVLAPITS